MPYRATDVMWAEAVALLARADRLHRQFFQPAPEGWEPPLDILETERELILLAALPGVDAQEIDVSFGGGELAISGVRRWPDDLRRAHLHRLEIPHGRFLRRVRLPAGSYELARRDLRDGLLTLVLRKS
ncbi:MAG: Hsp20/alpha crystallin family protein [Acidisphaera sp.]|nr:Hsp20/alpha crystallin family protein [Acidisphaera sp.]